MAQIAPSESAAFCDRLHSNDAIRIQQKGVDRLFNFSGALITLLMGRFLS